VSSRKLVSWELVLGNWDLQAEGLDLAGPTRLELATSGVTGRSASPTKTYPILTNQQFSWGFWTGRITRIYQNLPSQVETKRKHPLSVEEPPVDRILLRIDKSWRSWDTSISFSKKEGWLMAVSKG